jgi:pimeloyl-ACP methyl ester carboxylesterase
MTPLEITSQAFMYIPAKSRLPILGEQQVQWQGHVFSLPYLYREGTGGPSLLFVHGLGGAKENFYWALQSPALATCTLAMFDQPGTGISEFRPDIGLDVSGLAQMTQLFVDRILPGPYWLAGASMGGLISLLLLRRAGRGRVQGIINLEGNLCPEDCMFSRRVIPHTPETLGPIFETMMVELRSSRFVGDQIIAHNMALNVDIRAYHAYSVETVKESDSGRLLEEFLSLRMPKLFLYGEHNRSLSYLARLRSSDVQVAEIHSAAHFLFYDNPVTTYQTIGTFVNAA